MDELLEAAKAVLAFGSGINKERLQGVIDRVEREAIENSTLWALIDKEELLEAERMILDLELTRRMPDPELTRVTTFIHFLGYNSDS